MNTIVSIPASNHADARVARLVDFYHGLSPNSLPQLAALYAPEARFVDPFNDVTGQKAIAHIFEHMFQVVQRPQFVVQEAIAQGDQAVLIWRFTFEKKGLPSDMAIQGTSLIQFDAQSAVVLHRDYWDANTELFVKLPIVGGLFRRLTKAFATPAAS